MARTGAPDLAALLQRTFVVRHVSAILKHFQDMTTEFQQGAWEQAIGKSGKFAEATLKALYVHAGKSLPPSRQFKVDRVVIDLAQLAAGSFDDTVRLTIPRACRFVYDISSNRGARHDPDEIDPNQMDARVVVATTAWVLAEMLRYAQKGALDPPTVEKFVDGLTQRQYPLIESVDGRVYFHVNGASARDVAILSLWQKHPGRITREELIVAVMRHSFSKENATIAVTRLAGLIDRDDQGRFRLLQPGIRRAENLIAAGKD